MVEEKLGDYCFFWYSSHLHYKIVTRIRVIHHHQHSRMFTCHPLQAFLRMLLEFVDGRQGNGTVNKLRLWRQTWTMLSSGAAVENIMEDPSGTWKLHLAYPLCSRLQPVWAYMHSRFRPHCCTWQSLQVQPLNLIRPCCITFLSSLRWTEG